MSYEPWRDAIPGGVRVSEGSVGFILGFVFFRLSTVLGRDATEEASPLRARTYSKALAYALRKIKIRCYDSSRST